MSEHVGSTSNAGEAALSEHRRAKPEEAEVDGGAEEQAAGSQEDGAPMTAEAPPAPDVDAPAAPARGRRLRERLRGRSRPDQQADEPDAADSLAAVPTEPDVDDDGVPVEEAAVHPAEADDEAGFRDEHDAGPAATAEERAEQPGFVDIDPGPTLPAEAAETDGLAPAEEGNVAETDAAGATASDNSLAGIFIDDTYETYNGGDAGDEARPADAGLPMLADGIAGGAADDAADAQDPAPAITPEAADIVAAKQQPTFEAGDDEPDRSDTPEMAGDVDQPVAGDEDAVADAAAASPELDERGPGDRIAAPDTNHPAAEVAGHDGADQADGPEGLAESEAAELATASEPDVAEGIAAASPAAADGLAGGAAQASSSPDEPPIAAALAAVGSVPALRGRREGGRGAREVAAVRQRVAEPRQTYKERVDAEDRPIIAVPEPRRSAGLGGWSDDALAEPGAISRARSLRSTRGRPEPPGERRDDVGARQRQSPRIEGGGTVMIDDVLYRLLDWSTGGIAVNTERRHYRVGDIRSLELELDFGDYAVNLDLTGRVANRSSGRIGWAFIGPSGAQRQVLRSLSHAALYGEPFAAPASRDTDLADMIARTGPRRQRHTAGRFAWRLKTAAALMSLPFNLMVVALIAGVAILSMASGDVALAPSGGVPEVAPQVVSTPALPEGAIRAVHAAVAVARVPLVASVDGRVTGFDLGIGDAVDRGEPMAHVERADGEATEVIRAPCSCTLARIVAASGTRVSEGDTLALLTRRGARGHVQALFATDSVPRPDTPVSVDLPYSGDSFLGVVESIGEPASPDAYIGLPPASLRQSGGAVLVRIRTTPPVPAEFAGDPAIVTVEPGS